MNFKEAREYFQKRNMVNVQEGFEGGIVGGDGHCHISWQPDWEPPAPGELPTATIEGEVSAETLEALVAYIQGYAQNERDEKKKVNAK